MLKKTIIYIFMLFFIIASANSALALDNLSNSKTIAGSVAKNAGYSDAAGVSLDSTIGKVIQVALSFVGVVFLILMIYGGYLWMTARGEEQTVTKAKSLIQAAVIGLIIVVMAYAISYFVLKNVGGEMLNQGYQETTSSSLCTSPPCE
jgi:hypothetical protein